MDTIPLPYYVFFWLVEPILSISGAIYAIFRPAVYGADMLPEGVEGFTAQMGATIRGEMLIGGLGSCFGVLAMVSLSLLPVFKYGITDMAQQERLMTRYMIPLAIGDVTHIILTLRPLPHAIMTDPSTWTQLIHGNVNITIVLLLVRTLYVCGVGRQTAAQLAAPAPATPAKRRPGRPRKSE